jgi:hypothetical protein
MDVARSVKEAYCYVCSDLIKEYGKYDTDPDKCFRTYEGIDPRQAQGAGGRGLQGGRSTRSL